MYDEEEKRINFGKNYNLCQLTFHSITLCTLLALNINVNQSIFLTKSAENLSSVNFLFVQSIFLIFAIYLSKRSSQYRGALCIPSADDFSVNWKSIQKRSFGTRFGVNLRYYTNKVFCIANSENRFMSSDSSNSALTKKETRLLNS